MVGSRANSHMYCRAALQCDCVPPCRQGHPDGRPGRAAAPAVAPPALRCPQHAARPPALPPRALRGPCAALRALPVPARTAASQQSGASPARVCHRVRTAVMILRIGEQCCGNRHGGGSRDEASLCPGATHCSVLGPASAAATAPCGARRAAPAARRRRAPRAARPGRPCAAPAAPPPQRGEPPAQRRARRLGPGGRNLLHLILHLMRSRPKLTACSAHFVMKTPG